MFVLVATAVAQNFGYCGSGQLQNLLIPDTFLGVDFGICCLGHDRCYMTCGSSKATCDNNFQSCLYTQCNNYYSSPSQVPQRYACLAGANTYAQAVKNFGDSAFASNQAIACATPAPAPTAPTAPPVPAPPAPMLAPSPATVPVVNPLWLAPLVVVNPVCTAPPTGSIVFSCVTPSQAQSINANAAATTTITACPCTTSTTAVTVVATTPADGANLYCSATNAGVAPASILCPTTPCSTFTCPTNGSKKGLLGLLGLLGIIPLVLCLLLLIPCCLRRRRKGAPVQFMPGAAPVAVPVPMTTCVPPAVPVANCGPVGPGPHCI